MDLQLKGKTVIITGGTKGIGSGCAEAFAEEGANVVLVYRSDKEGSEAFAKEIAEKYNVGALAYQADITDPTLIDGIYDTAIEKYGQVDILVNNAAGGIPAGKKFEDVTYEEWQTAMDGCLNHVFSMSRRFVQDCRGEKRKGHIVNVLSKGAFTTNSKNNVPYVASKGGMRIMTRAMANDLIDDGIYVNGVIPGYVVTAWHQPGSKSAEQKEGYLRVGWTYPRDIGNVAAFLCSPQAGHVVGALVDCSGGTML